MHVHRDDAGATLHPNGTRREKSYRAEWSKEQAEEALAKAKLQIAPKVDASSIRLAQACERYLGTMTNRGNPRSPEERRIT